MLRSDNSTKPWPSGCANKGEGMMLMAAIVGFAVAVQTGTIVKLIRVLMLGPVIAALSVIHGRSDKGRLKLQQMVLIL